MRQVYSRPPFGETRFWKGEIVSLVAYVNDNKWYYVTYNPAGVAGPNPPKLGTMNWSALKKEEPNAKSVQAIRSDPTPREDTEEDVAEFGDRDPSSNEGFAPYTDPKG